MKTEQFVDNILNSDWETFYKLAHGDLNLGGWEGWLQVNWAAALKKTVGGTLVTERERSYPGKSERCDFYVAHGVPARDETYIELKCVNFKDAAPAERVFDGFKGDIEKLRGNLTQGTGIAVMVNYCSPKYAAAKIQAMNESGLTVPLQDVAAIRVSPTTYKPVLSKPLPSLSSLSSRAEDGAYMFMYTIYPKGV